MNQYSTTIDKHKISHLTNFLNKERFDIRSGGKHVILDGKKPHCRVILYSTLKLLIQGRETDRFVGLLIQNSLVSQIQQPLKKTLNVSPSNIITPLPRIGSDESGKGDYFGPLVIAAVYVDSNTEKFFQQIGVKDSKLLSDNMAKNLGHQIRNNALTVHVTLEPKKYNELYAKIRNLNRMLGWGHARAIENILSTQDCPFAIADQFGDESLINNALMEKGRNIDLQQRPKAESDIAVAAASIVAREEFLNRLDILSNSVGLELPKGASNKVIATAIQLTEKFGFERLQTIAKIHFKTTEQVKSGRRIR